MITEVYLIDDKESILVIDLKTNKMLYKFSYRHEGSKIWDYQDSWRLLRKNHLRKDMYKEVFKCKCGNVLRLPARIELSVGAS